VLPPDAAGMSQPGTTPWPGDPRRDGPRLPRAGPGKFLGFQFDSIGRLARRVCGLLCDAGVREDAMTLIFRDATESQVAEGRGFFPFWPERGSPGAG